MMVVSYHNDIVLSIEKGCMIFQNGLKLLGFILLFTILSRYNGHLDEAKKNGIKKGITVGWSTGLVFLVVFCAYGLGFWYGAKLIREDDNYRVSNVLIVSYFYQRHVQIVLEFHINS